MLRGSFALFIAFLLMTVISSAQSDAIRDTGIEGTVMVSPTRPGPIRKGSEAANVAPLPNANFIVKNDRGAIVSFATDGEGRFRVSLAPGRYAVSLAENRFPRPCGPFEVEVDAGRMTKVEWRCDTGMR